jgi:hypothetical protein
VTVGKIKYSINVVFLIRAGDRKRTLRGLR